VDLGEVQRQKTELALKLRQLEQRAEQAKKQEAENVALRRRVETLSTAAEEVTALRARVRDLEAQHFARRTLSSKPPIDEPPSSRGPLEMSLELSLRDVMASDEGCRAAVLSDDRGLLIAAFGDRVYRHELAAAASLTTYTISRLREILPLGEAVNIAVVDRNDVLFRTRWIKWQDEDLLLSTLGIAPEEDQPEIDVLTLRLAEIIGAP
jgi:hypothetical protein